MPFFEVSFRNVSNYSYELTWHRLPSKAGRLYLKLFWGLFDSTDVILHQEGTESSSTGILEIPEENNVSCSHLAPESQKGRLVWTSLWQENGRSCCPSEGSHKQRETA